MGFLDSIIGGLKLGYSLVDPGVEIVGAVARGDVEAVLEATTDYAIKVFEGQQEAVDLITAVAQIVAVVVAAKIQVALESGALKEVMDSAILLSITEKLGPFKAVFDRLQREQQRINGVLNQVGIDTSIAGLKRLHRLGLIISPLYREQIGEFNQEIRTLSRNVFGEASTLASSMQLINMVVHDITGLRGEPVELAQTKTFGETLALAEMVEKKSATYARKPSEFYADFELFFGDPLQSEKNYLLRTNDSLLARAADNLVITTDNLRALDRRFIEYQEELAPLIDTDVEIRLSDMRRDWKEKVVDPIAELNLIVKEDFLDTQLQAQATAAALRLAEDRLDTVTEITQDPALLNEQQRAKQVVRFDSIFSNVFGDGTSDDMAVAVAIERQESIFNELNKGP